MKLKLCYVKNGTAYFTTKALSKQWGDDWNDAPYEHNAGLPYDEENIKVIKFEAELETPSDRAYGNNSHYSAERINKRAIPWLQTPEYIEETVKIWAGISPEEFIGVIVKMGGKVWLTPTTKPDKDKK